MTIKSSSLFHRHTKISSSFVLLPHKKKSECFLIFFFSTFLKSFWASQTHFVLKTKFLFDAISYRMRLKSFFFNILLWTNFHIYFCLLFDHSKFNKNCISYTQAHKHWDRVEKRRNFLHCTAFLKWKFFLCFHVLFYHCDCWLTMVMMMIMMSAMHSGGSKSFFFFKKKKTRY